MIKIKGEGIQNVCQGVNVMLSFVWFTSFEKSYILFFFFYYSRTKRYLNSALQVMACCAIIDFIVLIRKSVYAHMNYRSHLYTRTF